MEQKSDKNQLKERKWINPIKKGKKSCRSPEQELYEKSSTDTITTDVSKVNKKGDKNIQERMDKLEKQVKDLLKKIDECHGRKEILSLWRPWRVEKGRVLVNANGLVEWKGKFLCECAKDE